MREGLLYSFFYEGVGCRILNCSYCFTESLTTV